MWGVTSSQRPIIHFTDLQTYPCMSAYNTVLFTFTVALASIHTTTVEVNRMSMNLSQIKLVVSCFLKTGFKV